MAKKKMSAKQAKYFGKGHAKAGKKGMGMNKKSMKRDVKASKGMGY